MLWLSYLGINLDNTVPLKRNILLVHIVRTIERYFQCALRGIHMEAATEWNVDDVDDS